MSPNPQAGFILPITIWTSWRGWVTVGMVCYFPTCPRLLKPLGFWTHSLASISGFRGELVPCIWSFLNLGTSLSADSSQSQCLLSPGSWTANKPVWAHRTVKMVLLVKKNVCADVDRSAVFGKLRRSSPSYWKSGRGVFSGFWKDRLQPVAVAAAVTVPWA